MISSCEESARWRAAKAALPRLATSPLCHEPAALARRVAGNRDLEKLVTFHTTRLHHEPFARDRPSRFRSIPPVDRNAHSPVARRAGTKWRDRGLVSEAIHCFSNGALTRRCTGQAREGCPVGAWRDCLGSSIILRGKPALAGELSVRATRRSKGRRFGWAPR
jgi:hypothetical protein